MREVWEARELLWSFALRELRIRYKQSFLGLLWAIIQPLVQMLVFTIVFSKVAKLDSEGLPYPVFLFAGLLPWTLFSSSMNLAIPSLASNADLINKVYFPRMVVPLSAILVAGADFLVSAGLLVIMMFWYHVPVSATVLYVIPLMVIHVFFSSAVCLFFAGLNVFYRDVRYALPLILQLWIYVVPVFYSAGQVAKRIPKYEWLYMADPIAVVVDGFRRSLVRGEAPSWPYFLLGLSSSLVCLILAVIYFRWVEQAFADIV